ncbi:MAG: nitronate monooxygenase, partial [Pseudomonadota bacterium]
SKVFDVARDARWPWEYTGRVVANAYCRDWHSRIDVFREAPEEGRARYAAAAEDDFSTRVTIAGEALDLIDRIEPAVQIVERVVAEAADALRSAPRILV